MKRAMLAALFAVVLVPSAATAKIIELGETKDVPVPSCPGPEPKCYAISRTTGYQVKVGTQRDLFTVPRRGRIVAWTAITSQPSKKQIEFFNSNYGGEPSAGLTVFKPAKHLYGTIVAQSPVENLTDYLDRRVQFPLENTIEVRKGMVIGLTVPTWAPMLAVDLGADTSWRASRDADSCDDNATQTAQTTNGKQTRFLCLYQGARLTYSVTIITRPHKNKKSKSKSKTKPTTTPKPTATPKA